MGTMSSAENTVETKGYPPFPWLKTKNTWEGKEVLQKWRPVHVSPEKEKKPNDQKVNNHKKG